MKGQLVSVTIKLPSLPFSYEAKPALNLQNFILPLGRGQFMHANKPKLYSASLPVMKICKSLGEVVANLWSWQMRISVSADPLTFS